MPVRSILAAAALLAACSSSSSTDTRDFVELSDAFDALNTSIDALPATTILPPGSATYAGLARIDYALDGEQRVLVGDAALTADFDAATVSGTLSRFVDSREGAASGRIAVAGGTISGVRIDGLGVSGDVDVGDRTLTFAGTGRGQFKGDDAEAVRIEMGGMAAGPDQPGWIGAAYADR
jgi:hypothetical protein